MDVVTTVEISIDLESNTIHLFDGDGALYPMYDYGTKSYIENDEFIRLKIILLEKQFMERNNLQDEGKSIFWLFYTPKKKIRCFETNGLNGTGKEMNEIPSTLLEKYKVRITKK